MGNFFSSPYPVPSLPDGFSQERINILRDRIRECPKDSSLNLDTNRFNLISKLEKKIKDGIIHISSNSKFFSERLDLVLYFSWLTNIPVPGSLQPVNGYSNNLCQGSVYKRIPNPDTSYWNSSKNGTSATFSKETGIIVKPSKSTPINIPDPELDQLGKDFVLLSLDNEARPAIPNKVRVQVWRNHTNGHMDGKCYCCRKAIKLDNNGINTDISDKKGETDYRWECGHILSYRNGGADAPINLRPLCFSCNRSMSYKHMILYMIENKSKGLKYVPTDLPLLYEFLTTHYQKIMLWQAKQEQKLKNTQISIDYFRQQQRIMYYNTRDSDETRISMLTSN